MPKTQPPAKARYALFDTLRGGATISMIVYHAVWDLVYLAGFGWTWLHGSAGYLWQQITCWLFFLLAGFSWRFSRRHLRRGLIVLGAGALVSVVTALLMPAQSVVFGVLTQLGFCTLLLTALAPVLEKIKPRWGLFGSAALFFITRGVNEGYLGFGGLVLCRLPAALYQNRFTAFLGFPPPHFFSTDYFSVFPWVFLFVAGWFLARSVTLRHGGVADLCIAPLAFVGRHSLLIYLLHQPILYAGLLLFT